jgi:Protein of unknown function (DUF2800)
MRCPGAPAAEAPYPRGTNSFADEGTVAHHIAATCLNDRVEADVFTGLTFGPENLPQIGCKIQVTQDMAQHVQTYVDLIRRESDGHMLQVEQKVSFGEIVGIPDQFGTGDAFVITQDGALASYDLKFGRGVKVFAEENEQLQIYLLGKLMELTELGFEFTKTKVAIHQPRLDHYDEWAVAIDDLLKFGEELKVAAAKTLEPDAPRIPGKKQCQWCAHKANCPELASFVAGETGVDFDNLDELLVPVTPSVLAQKMNAIELIEDWCKAVRAAVEGELFAGHPVDGWKLVEGKRGARSWADESAAEELLRKKFRLTIEEAYNLNIISPTQAEKLLKDSPRRWAQLEPLVSQSAGKPSVAPVSDKRPEYTVAASFDNLEEK